MGEHFQALLHRVRQRPCTSLTDSPAAACSHCFTSLTLYAVLAVCLTQQAMPWTLSCQSHAGARAIHDNAYRWPMYSPISAPVSYGPEDIAIFTLSSLTGTASSNTVQLCLPPAAVTEALKQVRTHARMLQLLHDSSLCYYPAERGC